jgi:hypothetical protein
VQDLKSYVLTFDRVTLRKLVEAQNGELAITLNGQKVSLKHRKHFFFDLRDMQAAA